MRLWVGAAVAVALFASVVRGAVAETISPSWKLCAASTTIVVGTLHVPDDALRAAQGGDGDYVDLAVDVAQTLKGASSRRIVVRFYSKDTAYAPSSKTLLAMNGRPVMAFLTTIDVGGPSGAAGTYFAGDTPSALRAPSPGATAEIRAEVARQARVLRDWRPHPDWPHHAAVKALIAKTLRAQTEEQAFKDLEALGPDAVPAIADLMDDRRALGEPRITLNNPPDFFEATSHYAPELVVDALAVILGQITGEHFGAVANGGSNAQRRLAVDGWRIYADAQRAFPKKATPRSAATPVRGSER
ncbi:MAG TPA: hypothetical protein VHS78_17870 [Candidatus Elarobacter sp.]|jgi:hypothetical protein|nr:hypothetical protein [Candidatus Elarobacter sp.]